METAGTIARLGGLVRFITLLIVAATLASVTAPSSPRSRFLADDSRCFELRTYTVAPDKFDALHTRFAEHATGLFKKHAMTVVGFWVPDDKPDTLVYMLAFPNRSAAEASWRAFRADPEWIAAQTESERGGKLVTHVDSVFMGATTYSPIK
jgi:hypothetical protein